MKPVAPSIQVLREEPTQPPAEPQYGRDELNLAEFPLAALSSRVSPRMKTLVFQDRIRDQRTGELVARRLTVTASDKYGLPTALDDDVVVGLVQLTKAGNDFTDRTVRFSRYALVRLLGWPDSGQSYRRVEESLKRWLGVTLSYEKAWWDKGSKSWVDEHFHLIDNVTLVHLEARRKRGVVARQGELPLSSFSWNSVVFRSFQAENLKRLDLNLYFRLAHAPAKRAFRFLDKRFYRRSRLEFDLRDFACEHVGFSRNYDIGKLKEKLQPSIEELERADVLEPLSRAERYVQVRPGLWRVVFIRKAPQASAPPSKARGTPHEQELVKRGVSATTAAGLAARHSPEEIRRKIEAFDWLRANRNDRVSKNPAGYLVQSIREDYAAPPAFAPRGARDEQRRAEGRRRGADAALAARRKAEAEARRDAEKDPIRRYWNSLSPRDQEALRDDALSKAESWLLERYQDAKPHLAKHFLQIIIERYVEKNGLAGPGR